jgi:AAA+ ATPase superfamily predicted ATPase
LFDREVVFNELAGFVGRGRGGLAIVRGRRRHGKSVILRALAEAGGWFYYQAVRGLPAEQRRDLAAAYARHTSGPEPRMDSWAEVFEVLLRPGATPAVIIDEVPYLSEAAPEFESVLQRALDGSTGRGTPLILCGSAASVMTGLLVGAAPLRGRAQLEIDVGPFEYRTAAAYWGLTPSTAIGVHAAIGGIPGYATELIDWTFPRGPGDLDRWLLEVVASPRRPLVHEARSMLDVEPGIRNPAGYQAVLAAIGAGATRTGEIAARIGRGADAVSHSLRTLGALGLVERQEYLIGSGRAGYAVADPLLRLHAALFRPNWQWVERGDAVRLGEHILAAWRAQILGPHLEQLLRQWVLLHAAEDTVGGAVHRVGRAITADRAARTGHEVDLVALDRDGNVLAIGEAKWRKATGADLDRLAAVRGLLPNAENARLILCSAGGFGPGLRRRQVELVDAARLYTGD